MGQNLHVDPAVTVYEVPSGQVVERAVIPLSSPEDRTLPKVVAAVGGPDAWAALPVLDLGSEENLHNGYLDFVRPERMTAPLMRGVDVHGRTFLAVRFTLDVGAPEGPELHVETLFRRYRTGSLWSSGGASMLCTASLRDEDLDLLGRLVRGEPVGLRDAAWKEADVPPDALNVVRDDEDERWTFERGRLALL